MLLTYSQQDIQKLMIRIWGYLRFLIIIIHNVYCIPIYLFLNWFLLLPLFYINRDLYMTVENYLYNWLLYVVSSWSYGAGIQIDEFGDDLYKLNADKNCRILILANHQSTADVPLMMQSLESRSSRILLWIMDVAFKYTNFGVVSITHGDYFLNTKGYKPGDILTHVTKPVNRFKDTIVLFPEGGFRFKRIQSSNKYALKNNYPPLNYVTYPRFGAYTELMEPSVGITHVVDLTIAYEDIQNPLTIVDIGCGNRKSRVLFNYKVFSVVDTNNIRSNEWLNQLWTQKEEFLLKYYTDRQSLENCLTLFNTVSLNWFKVFAIHLFYLSFCLAFYLSFKLIKI